MFMYKLFYHIVQHMWLWGYKMKDDVQPCILMEHISTATSIYPPEEMEAFMNEDFSNKDIRRTLCLDEVFVKV